MRNDHKRTKISPKLKTPGAKMPGKQAEIPGKEAEIPGKTAEIPGFRRKFPGRRRDSRTVPLMPLKGLNICPSLFVNVMNLEVSKS